MEIDLSNYDDIKQEFADDNKNSPLKWDLAPIKFEQVVIDEDGDSNEFDPNYDPLEGSKRKSSRKSKIIAEAAIKQEMDEDEVMVTLYNDNDSPPKRRSRRETFECSVCDKKYKNLKSFEKHVTVHEASIKSHKSKERKLRKANLNDELLECLSPKNGVYTCTCGKGFHLRSSLVSCLQSHAEEDGGKLNLDVDSLLKLCSQDSNGGKLVCKKCNFTCKKTKTMVEHKLTHKKKNKAYNCDQCDYVGTRLNTLNRHKLIHTDKKPYTCSQCPYRCKLQSKLKRHELIHTSSTSFKCDLCTFACRLRGTMKKHAANEHGVVRIYYCDQCNYSGTRSSTLQRHRLVHQQDKPFACDQCNYRCKLSNKLKTHKLTHERGNSFTCDECGYITNHLGALKVHKRSHTKKGIFPCDLCPYATPLPEYLEAHRNIHRGRRAYPCMECSYVSTHSSSFRRHLFTHSGEKPYACDQCSFKACQENTLKIHKRTHSGERPYKCDECDYASSTAGTLKRHKLIHSPIVW